MTGKVNRMSQKRSSMFCNISIAEANDSYLYSNIPNLEMLLHLKIHVMFITSRGGQDPIVIIIAFF